MSKYGISKVKSSSKINSNNKLNFDLSSKTLEKHPSAKNLFNDEKSKKANNNIISFSLNENITDKKIKSSKNLNSNYSINIINTENKIANNDETFFIKSPQKVNKNNNNNLLNINSQEKYIFSFSDIQKQIDKEITINIINGKGFNFIEEKLSSYLKIN